MNILLVDDQPSVIASLVSCIPWHSLGLSSVFTAGSAREARRILERQRVDILLSDIEMPGEDGLDLLTWVREQSIDLECIFLTAHADFYYAKRAISLRVSDYIIQPARDEDVIRAVKKAVSARQAREQNADLIRYQGQDFDMKNVAAQSLFESWPTYQEAILDPEKHADCINRLRRLNLQCSAGDPCCLVYAHIRTWHRVPQSPSSLLTKYRRILDSAAGPDAPRHFTWFPRESNFFTILFAPLTDELEQALGRLYEAMEPEAGCTLRLLFTGTDLMHIREAITALKSREERFGMENGTGDVCFIRVETGPTRWETDPSDERTRQNMELIRRFIRSNMSEPLTRTQIAEALNIPAAYVSFAIRSQEGLSCKEYITRIKMEHARKLLRHSRDSIGDIAIQCGYDSFAYFSKVYRQTYGITPSSERDGKEADVSG